MKLQRTVSHNLHFFSLVPLVNVLIVVLAYFSLSHSFILQPGVSVALPLSPFALGPRKNTQVIHITQGSTPILYFRDRRVTTEELSNYLSENKPPESTLIIRAERTVPFDIISTVMNIGLQHGYSVALAGNSPQP